MSERRSLWGLRLLALALAILTWFFVSVEKRERLSEKVVEASVTYNTARNYMVLEPVQKVAVRVRGVNSKVRNLNPFMVDVVVDLPESAKHQVDIHLGPDNVILPDGLDVVSIDPNVLHLDLDQVITQMIPIRPKLVGEAAAGAIVGKPEVEPTKVLVSGPSSHIELIEALTTTPIDLTGHALDFKEQVAVVSPDPLVKVVQPSVVTVQVPLKVPQAGGE